jgi:hypothetical protein
MKRIIIIAVAIWLYSATFAFAVWTPPVGYGQNVSYNPSYGQPTRVLSTWRIGPYGVFSTSDFWRNLPNGCQEHVITRTTYRFSINGVESDTITMIVGTRCP